MEALNTPDSSDTIDLSFVVVFVVCCFFSFMFVIDVFRLDTFLKVFQNQKEMKVLCHNWLCSATDNYKKQTFKLFYFL